MTKKILKNPKYNWIIWAIVIVIIYIWSISGIGNIGIKDSAKEVSKSIFSGLFNPDWSYVYNGSGEDLVSLIIQTLAIAFLGTFISAILSVPFAFLSAHIKKGGRKFKSQTGKVILIIIRTFPEIVLAIMFIKAVGPGAFAGVLALSIHSIGMLGKLFSETLENADFGPSEAITSVGANKSQVLFFATLPTVLPEFLSLTLYRFEIAVRSASILGMVGAGGIGTPLIFAIQTRSWNRVGIILIGIIITVTLIDFISGILRKKLS
ncbi:phosphonate ABC transporter, permease protein PhnE [Companilactobacillus sp. DQM5]|uniref:phosphonate ABC transporter, permease protein PhnE n=1 Tax=Companilactobacillus sp. DQM5 TaxID=3463359 RepID=UPI00405847F1